MVTASIVLYKTPRNQIETVLESVAESNCVDRLYIVDNYPSDDNKQFFASCVLEKIIDYIPHENTGYGSSHNVALHKAMEENSDYHVILNPDIYFEKNVLTELLVFMDTNKDVGYIFPRLIYPSGEMQYPCKLLPTPFDLIFRRFFPKTRWLSKINDRYELKMSGYNKIMNPPCLSGCFMLMRLSTLKENNLFFDDGFFMYCEDFDLIRRIHRVAKTLYYPFVTVVHNHAKESYRNKKMLKIHMKSAIYYFNKYGWFFDKERRQMNKQILAEIQEL